MLDKNSQMRDLLAHPEFVQLLESYMPGATQRETFRCVYGMRLLAFIRLTGMLSEAQEQELYQKLDTLKLASDGAPRSTLGAVVASVPAAPVVSTAPATPKPKAPAGKPTISDVRGLKAAGLNTFAAVTAVDYWQAVAASEAGAAVINVNDVAVSRLLLGRPEGQDYSTSLDEIIMATKAVKNGSGNCLVIPSIPFAYYNTPAEAVASATRIIKETGADAVHMEGAPVECVKAVCNAGWPVLGHAGLTKYHFTSTGSHKFRGRTLEDAQEILDYCRALEAAGAFCVVLEGIPTPLGKKITESLGICTCGIGAGRFCNGQFLVTDDLMGLMPDFSPKFVKKYADLRSYYVNGIKAFVDDVIAGAFPDDAHSYNVKDDSYIARLR